jgi:hypothetical protein
MHYLLVYDHGARMLTENTLYTDSDEAVEAYSALEQEHRDDKGLEIVLVSAESLDIIRRTHGHYFAEAGTPLEMPLQMPVGTSVPDLP